MSEATCAVEGCDRSVSRRQWCEKHYKAWKVHGDPLVNLTPWRDLSPMERFSAKVEVVESGCWLWQGAKHRDGYGFFKVDGRQVYAHRWRWEQEHGELDRGVQLDHFVCDTPACVNPGHVRPVSARENNLRSTAPSSSNAAKDTCPRGHVYDEANTRFTPSGRRVCRACARAASAQRRASR